MWAFKRASSRKSYTFLAHPESMFSSHMRRHPVFPRLGIFRASVCVCVLVRLYLYTYMHICTRVSVVMRCVRGHDPQCVCYAWDKRKQFRCVSWATNILVHYFWLMAGLWMLIWKRYLRRRLGDRDLHRVLFALGWRRLFWRCIIYERETGKRCDDVIWDNAHTNTHTHFGAHKHTYILRCCSNAFYMAAKSGHSGRVWEEYISCKPSKLCVALTERIFLVYINILVWMMLYSVRAKVAIYELSESPVRWILCVKIMRSLTTIKVGFKAEKTIYCSSCGTRADTKKAFL